MTRDEAQTVKVGDAVYVQGAFDKPATVVSIDWHRQPAHSDRFNPYFLLDRKVRDHQYGWRSAVASHTICVKATA